MPSSLATSLARIIASYLTLTIFFARDIASIKVFVFGPARFLASERHGFKISDLLTSMMRVITSYNPCALNICLERGLASVIFFGAARSLARERISFTISGAAKS